MMDWHGKRVAVLGFGREGQAMAEYLLAVEAIVTVCDEREAVARGEAYERWQGSNIRWQLGPSYARDLRGFDLIVRSPGVPLHLPALRAAREAGIEITSQTKIFFALCPSPVIGVTGTKGKGTTSALIAEILKIAKKKCVLVGNIGESSMRVLPQLTAKQWVVYELSSFQLQDLDRSPHVAVMLGLTIDHQDYHQSPDEYFAAKSNILKFQRPRDAAVFNIDYPETRRLEAMSRSAVYHTSRTVPVKSGCYVAGDVIFRRMNGRTEHVCYRHEVGLRGAHNLENITAAIVAASLAGATLAAIRLALKSFRGLPHRLEFVGKVRGVEFWNDSYGTTPETTIAAVRSFTAPIVLLLGGSEKRLDYARLGEAVVESSVKTIVAIGLSAAKMYEEVKRAAAAKGLNPPPLVAGEKTMSEMVKAARRFAKPGDVVLLSPAAASFDKFINATDRGEQFRNAIIRVF